MFVAQKELWCHSDSPKKPAPQVREIKLELQAVRGELAGTRSKMFKIGVDIAVTLGVVVGAVLLTLRETGAVKEGRRDSYRPSQDPAAGTRRSQRLPGAIPRNPRSDPRRHLRASASKAQ